MFYLVTPSIVVSLQYCILIALQTTVHAFNTMFTTVRRRILSMTHKNISHVIVLKSAIRILSHIVIRFYECI